MAEQVQADAQSGQQRRRRLRSGGFALQREKLLPHLADLRRREGPLEQPHIIRTEGGIPVNEGFDVDSFRRLFRRPIFLHGDFSRESEGSASCRSSKRRAFFRCRA